jgi:hypothetical protein
MNITVVQSDLAETSSPAESLSSETVEEELEELSMSQSSDVVEEGSQEDGDGSDDCPLRWQKGTTQHQPGPPPAILIPTMTEHQPGPPPPILIPTTTQHQPGPPPPILIPTMTQHQPGLRHLS